MQKWSIISKMVYQNLKLCIPTKVRKWADMNDTWNHGFGDHFNCHGEAQMSRGRVGVLDRRNDLSTEMEKD